MAGIWQTVRVFISSTFALPEYIVSVVNKQDKLEELDFSLNGETGISSGLEIS